MYQTISAHFDSTYSIEHNNRLLISPNVNPELSCNNYYCVESGKTHPNITQIYDKIFEQSFREFQAKQKPSRRTDMTYLEYIRTKSAAANAKTTDARHKNNAIKEAYEVVICIGNRNTIPFGSVEFNQVAELLKETCDRIVNLPYVVAVTDKELQDKSWRPPDNCLVVLNLVTHCDEPNSCPGIHFTFIPCCKSSRGPERQALLKQTFKALGYDTVYEIAKDKNGNPIQKVDKNNKPVFDNKGNPVYKKCLVKKGVLDWLEAEIKTPLAAQMKERYGWERASTAGGRFHLDVKDYKIYTKNLEIETMNKKLANKYDDIEMINNKHYNSLLNYNKHEQDDYNACWKEYSKITQNFWDWYKREKALLKTMRTSIKTDDERRKLEIDHINNLLFRSNNLIEIIILLIMKIYYMLSNQQRNNYEKEIKSIIEQQSKLSKIAKEMSTNNHKTLKELKSHTCETELIKELESIRNKLIQEYDNTYKNKNMRDVNQIFDN